MSSRYPILDNRPIDQWKVTELKEELKRRKLTTRGLKDDLVRRLDESIRSEIEKSNLTSNNGLDSAPQSQDQPEQKNTEEKDHNNMNLRGSTDEKLNEDAGSQVPCEQERSDAKVSVTVQETIQDTAVQLEQQSAKEVDDTLKPDTNDFGVLGNEGKIKELEIIDGTDSAELEKNQVIQVAAEVATEIVPENVESVVLSRQDLPSESDDLETKPERDHLEARLENDDSKPSQADDKLNESDSHNQVSEVNPVLGVEVKSDSISTETLTINEKNELKDNIIADDVKIELDVKPDMVQPSSSDHVTDGGKSHPMDVEEPHTNKVSMEETGGNSAESVDDIKKNDTGDLSSEKLNLDRSSGDDFMEDDVMEGKQIDSKSNFDEVGVETEKEESPPAKEEGVVDIVGEDVPVETEVTIVDEKNAPTASSMKRKLNDQQAVVNNDSSKRQRKWNSEGLKISEPQSSEVLPSTPKEAFQPALKRSFSRSDSNAGEEAPKERLVPPSSKPPTNSLRIDRFLRPFTLKALQELLGRTGTVIDFWMDHIKTHCYVSYSSVEEAVETRNGVYNLQWPPNGGRLLIAEFVDPQEVKARVEAPPQSPSAPANSAASVPHTPQAMQLPQPSPRQQVQKQQLQPPALPPPPPPHLSNPPTPRDHPTPVRERLTLPPPPPLPEKVDPPIVTLDDLFKKTKATPRIYYLPLSDEQVAAKLQAQGKTVKQ